MTPKGDHIPKEDRGEGTRWKAPLTTRPEKRNPGGGNITDLEKAGHPGGPTQAEAQSVSRRQWNRTTTKSKPNQRGEINVTNVN